MRSALSWISPTDIISRPVAFALFRFFKNERTLLALVGRSLKHGPVLVRYVLLINITIWRINLTGKLWNNSSDMVIKFIRNLSRIDY